MLALVSRILTSAFQDTLQVAMAMEGVVNLCLHEVVDVVTAWSVLGRVDKLASDTRYTPSHTSIGILCMSVCVCVCVLDQLLW